MKTFGLCGGAGVLSQIYDDMPEAGMCQRCDCWGNQQTTMMLTHVHSVRALLKCYKLTDGVQRTLVLMGWGLSAGLAARYHVPAHPNG